MIAALSPAGPVNRDEVERGAAALKSEGYRVRIMGSALERDDYLAGADASRARDLMDAFLDPDIDAILCTRGGYGSLRILDSLDYDSIRRNPKPFIGFSDISALQSALWQRTNLITFSGPQLARGFAGNLDDLSLRSWFEMLKGELWNKPLPMPGSVSLTKVHSGEATGTLLGGNLAVLTSLCGTKWQPSFRDSILLIEEIDEPPYRIDRMLTQLTMSGALDGVRGVLLGRFTQSTKEGRLEHHKMATERISELIGPIPLATGAPYGHVGPCWTVPLGANATLDTETGSLTVILPEH